MSRERRSIVSVAYIRSKKTSEKKEKWLHEPGSPGNTLHRSKCTCEVRIWTLRCASRQAWMSSGMMLVLADHPRGWRRSRQLDEKDLLMHEGSYSCGENRARPRPSTRASPA